MSARDRLRLLVAVAVLGATALVYIYGAHLPSGSYAPIRSDGVAYYVYLPEALLHRDPGFWRVPPEVTRLGPVRVYGLRQIPDTERFLEKVQLGEAVLLMPFFALGHAAAVVSGAPRNGFSTPYQYAVATAGLAYLLAGLYFLSKLLGELFSRGVALWTCVLVLFATNLFHYATYDAAYSHVYSFALFCFVLYEVRRWSFDPTWRSTVLLGIGSGMFALVRLTNILLLVAIVVYALYGLRQHRVLLSKGPRAPNALGVAAVSAAVFAPQLVEWRITTGHWIYYSYSLSPGDELRLQDPHVLQVLFSIQKGLFFWSPILVLAVVGLFFLRRYDRGLAYGAAVALPMFVYVVSSWKAWGYGGSFGHRAFVESLPLFALGLGALVESLRAGPRRAVLAVSCLLALLSIVLMVQYWRGVLPIAGVTPESFARALLP